MIGPTFSREIEAAGLGGLPFTWSADGAINGRENLTGLQSAALDGVLAAHDPAKRLAPAQVTSAQAKIALLRAGRLASVKAVVAAYPEEVQIWFSDAQVWERVNPYVMGIGLELDLDDAELDALFLAAGLIV